MHDPYPNLRRVWFALALIFAVMVGVGAGVLTLATGSSAPDAVLAGGLWFGGTLGLAVTVLAFLA